MESLNYHHLRYFWVVAKEGSIRKASEKLRVSQPSICVQVQSLEETMGEKLFRRSGRNLVMTETGQLVFGYADEIFSLGGELVSAMKQGSVGRALKLNVGVTDSLPKLVAQILLEPVFDVAGPVHVVCREGKAEDLLVQLASMRLDIILADEPASTGLPFKTFNHLLGSSGVTFCASAALAKRLRKGFPKSLNGAPALLPAQNTNLRRSLEKWFHALNIHPTILAEFEDGALMKAIASGGRGFIPLASVVADEAVERYRFKIIGATEKCTDQFFAITAERRLTHSAVVLITENAQKTLFG